MATVDLEDLEHKVRLYMPAPWAADVLALIRHVERYEAALRHYASQWVIGPFGERVDIGHVASEALKEEPDSAGRRCDCGHLIADHEDGALCHLCDCRVPLFPGS
jgi:hypothetical protein